MLFEYHIICGPKKEFLGQIFLALVIYVPEFIHSIAKDVLSQWLVK